MTGQASPGDGQRDGYDSPGIMLGSKLAAAGFLAAVGLLGAFIPLFLQKCKVDRFVNVLNTFAAGAFLGLAIFHIMPQAAESLEAAKLLLHVGEASPFNLAYIFFFVGYLAILVCEQVLTVDDQHRGKGRRRTKSQEEKDDNETRALADRSSDGEKGKCVIAVAESSQASEQQTAEMETGDLITAVETAATAEAGTQQQEPQPLQSGYGTAATEEAGVLFSRRSSIVEKGGGCGLGYPCCLRAAAQEREAKPNSAESAVITNGGSLSMWCDSKQCCSSTSNVQSSTLAPACCVLQQQKNPRDSTRASAAGSDVEDDIDIPSATEEANWRCADAPASLALNLTSLAAIPQTLPHQMQLQLPELQNRTSAATQEPNTAVDGLVDSEKACTLSSSGSCAGADGSGTVRPLSAEAATEGQQQQQHIEQDATASTEKIRQWLFLPRCCLIGDPSEAVDGGSFFLMAALAIHGLFEGVIVGAESNFISVWVVAGVIAAHKWAESFLLMSQFIDRRLASRWAWTLVAIFIASSPVGILMGTIIATENQVASGICNALGAGTLLYVAAEISAQVFTGTRAHRSLQLLVYCLGASMVFGLTMLDLALETPPKSAARTAATP